MLTNFNNIELPDETAIWRYMDLDRFLGLLTSKKLHLTRLGSFKDDPWEGTWPQPVLDAWKLSVNSKVEFLRNTDQLKQKLFVSCWHVSPHESAALWTLYSGRSGLAIKSTVGRLKAALNDERPYYIDRVQYKNFETDRDVERGTISLAFLKRKSFEHEKELRVVLFDPTSIGNHIRASDAFACDITKLVEEIYLSPTSAHWMLPNIDLLLKQFNLDTLSPIRSKLLDPRIS